MSGLGVTAFDVAVAAVLLLSAALALARGFVREVMSLASWAGAAAIAWLGYPALRPFAAGLVGEGLLAQLLTALAAFLVPLVLLRLLTGTLANAVADLGFGALDRLLGLAFGFARGALIVCAAYLVAGAMIDPTRFPPAVRDAALEPPVREGAAWLQGRLPANLAASGRAGVEGAFTAAREGRRAAGGEGAPDGRPSPAPGYGRDEREGMNRLIESVP